jgi:hypothetical protein
VGENAGDQSDAPLQYAEADAARVRDVLVQLGGVSELDAVLVRGTTAPELRVWLARLAERFAREGWGKDDRLLLYVSAHSAAGELHLRGSRFPLGELTRFLEAIPVGVAVLVLDTCEAGAALRAKGLEPSGAPVVQLARPQLTGRVVIASAGATESAFESDELRGSLFTHHFVSGLRGAADTSRDGVVTLQEAYTYAYARTVDTAATVRDARQTPLFEMNLSGSGELVLSDLQRGRARLTLDVAAAGEWVVASLDGGAQAARFVKAAGRAELALEPGTWRLRSRTRDFFAEETVTLAEGGHAVVTDADLAHWKLVPGGRKGGGPETVVAAKAMLASGAVAGLQVLSGGGVEVLHAPDVSAGGGRPLFSFSAVELVGRAETGAFYEREFHLVAGGGWEVFAGPLRLRLLAEGGAALVRQEGVRGRSLVAAQPRLDAQAGVAWAVTQSLHFDLSASAGGLLVRTDTDRHLRQFVAAGAGVEWSW